MRSTNIPIVMGALLVLTLLLNLMGVVGFSYPVFVQGETLENPVHVESIQAGQMLVADGRVIGFPKETTELVSMFLEQWSRDVEIKEVGNGEVAVFAIETAGGYCGTPFAQPIRIPIRKVEIPKNLKRLVTYGKVNQ